MALLLLTTAAMALPIDWGGSLGLDTTLIDNIRRSKDKVPTAKNSGTQGIANNDNGAHFQTYVFKLNPHLIVNDAVSIKGELSSGHTRGGFWGDNATQTQDQNTGSNSYYSTVPAQRSTLNVNQLYAELYADTALVRDCLFHFSFDDTVSALKNLKASGIKYLISTTFPTCTENTNIKTGGYRKINLSIYPYNLGDPLILFKEKTGNTNYSKSLGVWDLTQIEI